MTTIADAMKLSRSDIRHFDGDTIKLVLEMQDKGWRGIRNKNGHVTLYAPDGEHHIMATSNPRSHFYISQRLRRYEAGLPMEEEEPKVKTTQKWPCPRPNCQKTFVSDEKLSIHMAVDHDGLLVCPEDGCMQMFKKPNQLGLHRSRKHGYVSPQYEKRKLQEANRKKESEKPVETVEEVTPSPPIETKVEEEYIHVPFLHLEEDETVAEKPKESLSRPLELTDEVLSMDLRTLTAVLKAAGLEIHINVVDVSTQ